MNGQAWNITAQEAVIFHVIFFVGEASCLRKLQETFGIGMTDRSPYLLD